MQNKKYTVLLTGAGSVMGYSIYKALAKSSLAKNMQVVFTNSEDKGAGFFLDQHHEYPQIIAREIVPLANSDQYIPCIKSLLEKYEVDIVYSGTQHELRKLAENNLQITACPPLAIIDKCLDKFLTSKMLSECGLSVPQTFYAKDVPSYFEQIPEGKYIVKPNNSSSSRKLYICEDKEMLLKKCQEIIKSSDDCVAQEYIEGDEYTCGLYIDKINRSVNTIVLKRDLSADGASIYGKIVNHVGINSYVTAIGHALMKNGMDFGHVNVQLRLAGEVCYAFEINGRLSSTESPKAMLGFNSTLAYFENIVLNIPASEIKYNGKYSQFLRYYDEVYF